MWSTLLKHWKKQLAGIAAKAYQMLPTTSTSGNTPSQSYIMGNVTQAVKKRLSMGIVRRNEIIRLIERGINTAYSIAKAMDLDPGTVKHHLDWLEERGLVESTVVVEKGRAKKVFRLTFPVEVLERVMVPRPDRC